MKEYPQGLQTINKRGLKTELEVLFPIIDFSYLKSERDFMWNPERVETIDELNSRINGFKKFIFYILLI